MDATELVIDFKHGQLFYPEVGEVLSGLNFSISKGEFVYLLGKSGSGKSTLLKSIYADHQSFTGDLTVLGCDLATASRTEIAFLRRKLGIIFQDFELFSDRSVFDNLSFVLEATGWKYPSKIKKRIMEVLDLVRLEGQESKLPFQLSGGEQQRVVIARAILNNPELLIADEPTGNLDPEVAYQILNIFLEINKSGTSVLMATHHHNFLRKHPHRVILCEKQSIKDIERNLVLKHL